MLCPIRRVLSGVPVKLWLARRPDYLVRRGQTFGSEPLIRAWLQASFFQVMAFLWQSSSCARATAYQTSLSVRRNSVSTKTRALRSGGPNFRIVDVGLPWRHAEQRPGLLVVLRTTTQFQPIGADLKMPRSIPKSSCSVSTVIGPPATDFKFA